MPGLFYEPLSRKEFLATMAGAVIGTLPGLSRGNTSPADVVDVGLLSDTHIPADAANEYRGFRPVDNLKQIIPDVASAGLDSVIINGDAARLTGEKEDYAALRDLLSPVAQQTPVYVGLGNHDNRANFFSVFADESAETPVDGKYVAVIERPCVRILVLDSLLYVNRVAGLLGKNQRTWLSKFLADSDERPHVLFLHHTLGDGDGDLLDVDRLFQIIAPHHKVKAIFYGHSHRYSFDKRKHVHLVNLPAVGYNFADDQPVGWVQARFTRAGFSLTLRAIAGRRDEDGVTTSIGY